MDEVEEEAEAAMVEMSSRDPEEGEEAVEERDLERDTWDRDFERRRG